jgi:hypothetical protein
MLRMIEIGFKRERAVRVAEHVDGKRRLVAKRNADGTVQTKTVASEVTRITRGTLDGHFGRDSGRRLVVTLRDGDILELRPQGTRHALRAVFKDIFAWMHRSKAESTKMARLRERKAQIAERRILRRLRRPLRP